VDLDEGKNLTEQRKLPIAFEAIEERAADDFGVVAIC
jgi:hypothetical protein